MQTIDHKEIRQWIEDRGGVPACVTDTSDKNDAGILRIDFPDPNNRSENLTTIAWDDFFAKFDEAKLAFVCQDETADGETSRFNRFVSRD